MSVKIRIAGRSDFPCPLNWKVDIAEKRIRSGYLFDGGFIQRNGVALDSNDLITSDGDYDFVNFQEKLTGSTAGNRLFCGLDELVILILN